MKFLFVICLVVALAGGIVAHGIKGEPIPYSTETIWGGKLFFHSVILLMLQQLLRIVVRDYGRWSQHDREIFKWRRVIYNRSLF